MSATILPWWDSPAVDKPNEFEHGLMLGYLLIKGKQKNPWTNTPDERDFPDGSHLKTWVEKTYDEYINNEYRENYTLFQQMTYSDGTAEIRSVDNFCSVGWDMNYVPKGEFVTWKFSEAQNGYITAFNWFRYVPTTNEIHLMNGIFLPWKIPV